MKNMLVAAKAAKYEISTLTSQQKNDALFAMADALVAHSRAILDANEQDIKNAKGVIADVMIDRLMLTQERIHSMAQGIRNVASLPDPVGCLLQEDIRADGLRISKVSVPLGVIAIIY